MATPSIPITQAQPVPPVEINTPRWLGGSVVLVWLLGTAFVIASIVAVREQRKALDLIANQSAKSVIAAQRMASALADMDASAANGLLNPLQKDEALKSYQKSRAMMTDALVDAARNITFSGEEEAIKNLARDSGTFGALVEAAFTRQSTAASGTVAEYLKAAQVMDMALIPGAKKVDDLNRKELDASFESIGRVSLMQRTLVWLTGLGMIAVLLRLQFYLSERMRRTLNPLCVVATVLAAGLLLYTNHALSTASHETTVVKSDAFESIHLLWKTKAAAYQANALESRYLLDRQSAAKHQAGFDKLALEISNDPGPLARLGQSKPTAGMKGYLAEELANITFESERDAALNVAVWWNDYMQIDARIRALERAGQHEQAVKLCLGEERNESNWAFNGFIKALDHTLEINQNEFNRAAQNGFEALKQFEMIAPILGLIAALSCLFGVLPRIREYSA